MTPMLPMTVLVSARRQVADDVVALDLRPFEDGADLPAWDAGAHVDLVLHPGMIRQYSLCGDPQAGRSRCGSNRRGGAALDTSMPSSSQEQHSSASGCAIASPAGSTCGFGGGGDRVGLRWHYCGASGVWCVEDDHYSGSTGTGGRCGGEFHTDTRAGPGTRRWSQTS